MWRNKYILTALLLCIISVASFGIVKVGSVSNAQKGDFVIMTSFYPMYIATLNIAEGIDGVEVKNLTNNATGCLHDYQLSTKDLKQLDAADILVVNGADMESFLEDVYERYENLTVVTATEGLELIKEDEAEDEHIHEAEADTDEHIHEDEASEEEGHIHSEEEEHVHSHGEYNAHSWIDISLYMQEVENIAGALIENDPQHKSQYEANLKAYEDKLQELSDIADSINLHINTAGMNPKENGVVIFHEAFEYFENTCGFNVDQVVDMDENTALSAAQISNIIDKVNAGTTKYLLADETYGKAAAEAIEKECDVKVLYLDPLTSGADDADAYIDGMRKNLEVLKEAFVR